MVFSFGTRLLRPAVVSVFVLTATILTAAQTPSTATLIGIVADTVGVIPGATVTAVHAVSSKTTTAITDDRGAFRLTSLEPGKYRVTVDMAGFRRTSMDLTLIAGEVRDLGRLALQVAAMTETVTVTSGARPKRNTTIDGVPDRDIHGQLRVLPSSKGGGERYGHVAANTFNTTLDQPLSTFAADVDTASYGNIRRFLSSGQLPPADAVRVEELINYFHFAYDEPREGKPVALTAEIGDCPWAPAHKLVLIGARAKAASSGRIEGRNIVLLIDVSGSMAPKERLPLIRTALAQFVDTLDPADRIGIVTYAGTSGVALASTKVSERDKIQRAIASLNAGGSTNGASGIALAYTIARENFIKSGVNRVILATDGDFNVGVTSNADLWSLIERERESGVFLSVFGVGDDNLNDAMMEQLADRGNGHYAYLDTLQEARRVLVREGASTLETVAKDVKFQVEFNPAEVAAWKLIGYENRRLASEDFNDDRKDAGDLGAGHTVTVLYEIVPAGAQTGVDPLKYQPAARPTPPAQAATGPYRGEWLTVKVRYKAPDGDRSDLISRAVRSDARGQHLPLASAVAEFGLLLRTSAPDDRAWETLSRKVAALNVPREMVADKEGFADLVGIAAGLSKRR